MKGTVERRHRRRHSSVRRLEEEGRWEPVPMGPKERENKSSLLLDDSSSKAASDPDAWLGVTLGRKRATLMINLWRGMIYEVEIA